MWTEALHPLDRAYVKQAWDRAFGNGEPYRCEHRIRGAQGDYRWFLARAESIRTIGSGSRDGMALPQTFTTSE